MLRKRKNFIALIPLIISTSGLLLGTFAQADSSKSTKKSEDLLIVGALADFDAEALYIIGQGFGSGQSLRVSLGAVGDISAICSSNLDVSPQVIACDFSLAGMPSDGDYLLTVASGKKKKKDYDDYALTIGAVGPKGDSGLTGAAGVEGPPGKTGPRGPQGIPGAEGLPGIAGAAGPAGPQGVAGIAGPAGPEGPIGPEGATGVAGPPGLTGPIGPVGATGPVGAQGTTGPEGPPGIAGPEGPEGPAGAEGPAGPAGPQGLTGVAGPPGLTGATGLQGPAGVAGPAGTVGSTGPIGPPGVLGHQVVRLNTTTTMGPLGQFVQTATCPNSKRILSGGYGHNRLSSNVMVLATFSGPSPNTNNSSTSNTSWTVVWQNYKASSQELNLAVWVVCAENS